MMCGRGKEKLDLVFEAHARGNGLVFLGGGTGLRNGLISPPFTRNSPQTPQSHHRTYRLFPFKYTCVSLNQLHFPSF